MAARDKNKTEEVTTPVKEKTEEVTEQATIPVDQSKLSPLQQRLSGFVKSAKQDPPEITDVNELFHRVEMEIPKGVQRGPEVAYAWLSVDEVETSMVGSKWEIVTRSNHGHVNDRMFDMSGAILYKGQNILCFCRREARELEQAAIVKDFNQKTEKMTETKETASENEVRNIPIANAGNVVSGGLIDPTNDNDF